MVTSPSGDLINYQITDGRIWIRPDLGRLWTEWTWVDDRR